MTKAIPVQMPQRYQWDIVDYGTVDSYWVDADDVEPLVAEINRLRPEVERLLAEIERLRAQVTKA